jgi:hypothetical protein|tara:strand:+ start:724 stop:879 length:156 start_codon:yes stop_codon:yes gene_type:complete
MALVTACSDREEKQIGDTHVWKGQTDALEKAKNVEQLILDSTANRLKAIKE